VRAAHVLNQRFEDCLRIVDLTPTQFGVLATLSSEPEIGSGQLARRILVTPQSAGEVVSSLEAKGHVVRDRSGGPGRKIAIRLTPRGHTTLEQAWTAIETLTDPSTFGLGSDDATTLNGLLHRILNSSPT
jgi:DNA-binding MarR family transcriptional regulator